MKNAVLRLLGLIFASCAVIFTVLLIIRWMGEGQEFAPVKHALFEQKPIVILENIGSAGAFARQSLPALMKAKEQCPKCILRVDSRLSLDDVAFVFAEDDLQPSTGETGYFSLKTADEIRQLKYKDSEGSPVLALRDLMSAMPNTSFYVVIHSRDASKLSKFLEGMKERETKENLILGSPYRQ
ncbi:MAG: hypothetical protein AAF202_06720, partial [Pseudomonadota bacterium]